MRLHHRYRSPHKRVPPPPRGGLLAFPSGEGGPPKVVDEESILAGHNAAGSEVFYYFLCLCKESNPRKHTEETKVSSGSFLVPQSGIGFKGAESATIFLAAGAVRSERLYRAFPECIRSIGSRRGVGGRHLRRKAFARHGSEMVGGILSR